MKINLKARTGNVSAVNVRVSKFRVFSTGKHFFRSRDTDTDSHKKLPIISVLQKKD
jgi:beta-glucosidase-like glycosyl hydrolase